MTIAKMLYAIIIYFLSTKQGASIDNNEEDIQPLEHQLQKTIQDIA